MARRMFSTDIVSSDAFLEMPASSRELYFQLGMSADDDGFVNPKKIMRIVGAADDDLKVLLAKRFLLSFESGVVVIKHWLIHNLIRSDLYKETLYKKEKENIGLNENGAYTEMRENISVLRKIEAPVWLKKRRGDLRTANVPQTVPRIGKDRIGKVSKIHTPAKRGEYADLLFQEFWNCYPRKVGKGDAWDSWAKLTPSRELGERILVSVREHLGCDDWERENGRYVPHPATYLNQRRFEDELPNQIEQSNIIKIS